MLGQTLERMVCVWEWQIVRFGWSAGCMNEGHSVGAGDSVVPLDDV